MSIIIRFLNTLSAALLTGTIFGIWIGTDPKHLSMSAYVEEQQNMIRSLNVLMPVLGAITIVLTIANALLQRKTKATLTTLLLATGLFIVTGLITRLGNQPINAIVMSWDKSSITANWMELRDKWWFLHSIRTATSTLGLVFAIAANTSKD